MLTARGHDRDEADEEWLWLSCLSRIFFFFLFFFSSLEICWRQLLTAEPDWPNVISRGHLLLLLVDRLVHCV